MWGPLCWCICPCVIFAKEVHNTQTYTPQYFSVSVYGNCSPFPSTSNDAVIIVSMITVVATLVILLNVTAMSAPDLMLSLFMGTVYL